jgi:hypothetical protein
MSITYLPKDLFSKILNIRTNKMKKERKEKRYNLIVEIAENELVKSIIEELEELGECEECEECCIDAEANPIIEDEEDWVEDFRGNDGETYIGRITAYCNNCDGLELAEQYITLEEVKLLRKNTEK